MLSEVFVIEGVLSAPTFEGWVRSHADRIGVAARFRESGADSVSVLVEGPPALLDAMEMACLLGPIDVWVERIVREAA
ncbi:acylphosphatase [Paracoccus aestuariivivens]|uniref:Acylphosphatase n=1 Tax=Paracoccus aestuariivivens TaxID=1820333 RepID=A0A6L6JBR0_9RHOB|nr:acylphosphatase [Paracoccus aestuariivivens]MTH79633.1 acylphosphatase [Paracoccus aestuariivivens]